MATVRAHDCFVVESAPLSEMLRTFVASWERQPSRAPSAGGEPVSAIRHLAEQSGVPVRTLTKLTMQRPQNPTTALDTADALVTAIGHPEAFHDGTLQVFYRAVGKSELVPADSLTGAAESR